MNYQDITNLSKEIYEHNKKQGFWDGEKNIGEVLALIHSELSEALEADRENKHKIEPGVVEFLTYADIKEERWVNTYKQHVKPTFAAEMADVVIRVLDACGGLNIDIGWHIEQKLRYNKTREFKHGKKY